jgi:hypothetical protein
VTNKGDLDTLPRGTEYEPSSSAARGHAELGHLVT